MRDTAKKIILIIMAAAMLLMSACGSADTTASAASQGTAASGDFSAVADDYYLDLTDLGMKLTIYLRLTEDGEFLFSNTTAFEVNKSSGTLEEGEDGYMLIYESVNGEEKTLSDGLTSSFVVNKDGTLDFSGCERVYYGSASAVTVLADDPSVTLVGVPIPEDYEEPSTESEFEIGTYAAEAGESSYTAAFYEDNTYILTRLPSGEGETPDTTTGVYGVSTTQLALTPNGGSREAGEVVSATELKIPIDGESVSFIKQDAAAEVVSLSGTAQSDGGGSIEASLVIYDDGSYVSTANAFTEGGIIAFNAEAGTFKTYPDHPETGVRGLNQVSTVPDGTFTSEGGALILTDFRLRTSENLTRTKCSLRQG